MKNEKGSSKIESYYKLRNISNLQHSEVMVEMFPKVSVQFTSVHESHRDKRMTKKGKVFPYSLPSVGPGADPGVQAVSPQVT